MGTYSIRIEMIGEKYGLYSVISVSHKNNRGELFYNCVCDCGTPKKVKGSILRSGHTKSCGCTRADGIRRAIGKYPAGSNENETSEYVTWQNMKKRCYEETNISYKNYGGKGVIICQKWLDSYQDFLNDMGRKPTKSHSIERLNNKGNYEPSNCKWATRKEQNENKSTNVWVEYKGEKMVVSEFKKRIGVKSNYVNKLLKTMKPTDVENFYLNKAI